jgi:hypothetical protein
MMNATEETRTVLTSGDLNLVAPGDRRSDVDFKQSQLAELIRGLGVDGLLVLQPENFCWLSSGGTPRGNLDSDSMPGLYFTAEGRWLMSANVDTQRLFDEELDGLGFQLKEWPWHWGREQMLGDLRQGRKIAGDVPMPDCTLAADSLARMRRSLSEYERNCLRSLGQIISHALEATGRTFRRGDTEREVAGQLAHRLIHRGALPISVTVAADGRSRSYRQGSFTATPIKNYCVLKITARKYGLCATASRSICFNEPDAFFRKEHDAACKVCATYVASSWPDSVPRQILMGGQRVYQLIGAENEWYLSPQGHLTGRAAVELALTPKVEELLQANWAVTWHASVGSALSCDTFLITDDGARAMTAAESWPLKRIRTQGTEYVRPDVLVRD